MIPLRRGGGVPLHSTCACPKAPAPLVEETVLPTESLWPFVDHKCKEMSFSTADIPCLKGPHRHLLGLLKETFVQYGKDFSPHL